ncbi:hypothetical protein BDP27DRAFT_1399857 [Rhodocollybia butyracea]|uniref:DNA 3'-5' helicase n=1 Tax=Rhodocollybia butyracea TaxID=206335 RepID=A0A9P5PWT0_9AGAR|nr:hypothetical protein BDP27DRAFT_1399857 [Rhodocollybia butyracea]
MAQISGPCDLWQFLNEIRRDDWAQLGIKYATMDPHTRLRFPIHFILSLAPLDDGGTEPTKDQILLLRLCLLAFYATRGLEVPKIIQLQATLVSNRQNSLVVASTGFGKKHIMALLMLLETSDSTRIFITISPLKRLQATQVTSFLLKYGIKTLAINQDTRKDIDYWRMNIHDGRQRKSQQGTARHLIVTAEQLFKSSEGQSTQFALLLRNQAFQQRISHVNVDEIHFVHYAGMERFGVPALHSAWGRFSELKMTLPKTIFWRGFTVTCPPHVQTTLEGSLLGTDYSLMRMSINQPTIVYARHCVVRNFKVFANYLCFLRNPFPVNGTLLDQPRILIFFDNDTLTRQVARFLDQRAPPQFRGTGFASHYYSLMSPQYLEQVYDNFTRPDGPCRILCATSGETTGLNFPDVQIMVNVGVFNGSENDQQKGHRSIGGLHVVFYEPRVRNIKLNEFHNKDLPFYKDPDRPRTMLKPGSNEGDRIPRSGIECMHTPCVRENKSNYFADKWSACLDYTKDCCDRAKPNNDTQIFNFQDYLPGPLYNPPPPPATVGKRKATNNEPRAEIDDEEEEEEEERNIGVKKKKRAPRFQKPLLARLFRWRRAEHEKDPISGVFPEYLIISDDDLVSLSKVHPMYIHSVADVITELHEEVDGDFATLWAQNAFDVILTFDTEYPEETRKRAKRVP